MPVGEVLRGALDQLGLVLVTAEIDGPLHGHVELACAVVAHDEDRQQRSVGDLGQAGAPLDSSMADRPILAFTSNSPSHAPAVMETNLFWRSNRLASCMLAAGFARSMLIRPAAYLSSAAVLIGLRNRMPKRDFEKPCSGLLT